MEAIDVWRTAHILMREYGAEASLIAAKRADAFLAQGEMEAYLVWTRVISAIAELERDTPREGEAVN